MALRYSWNPPILKDVEAFQKAGCNVLAVVAELSFALHSQNQELEQRLQDANDQPVFSHKTWSASFEGPDGYSDDDIVSADEPDDDLL